MSFSNGSMTNPVAARGGYSARVRLFLRTGEEQIPLGQVGPDRVCFRKPTSVPSGAAQLIVEVDGNETVTPVVLEGTPEPCQIAAYSTA